MWLEKKYIMREVDWSHHQMQENSRAPGSWKSVPFRQTHPWSYLYTSSWSVNSIKEKWTDCQHPWTSVVPQPLIKSSYAANHTCQYQYLHTSVPIWSNWRSRGHTPPTHIFWRGSTHVPRWTVIIGSPSEYFRCFYNGLRKQMHFPGSFTKIQITTFEFPFNFQFDEATADEHKDIFLEMIRPQYSPCNTPCKCHLRILLSPSLLLSAGFRTSSTQVALHQPDEN